MKKLSCIFLALSCFAIATGQHNSSAIYQKLQKLQLPGTKAAVLTGKLSVFENWETKTGRKIELHVIVVPALHRTDSTKPIFFIEGGPGAAATNNARLFASEILPYRRDHDIVLIDARGTGKSNPLNCASLQVKTGLQDQLSEMYPASAVQNCYDSLSKIADLQQYTTTNVVKDLEAVRQWLGYKKVRLFGLSYGTRVALVYMKMFPSSIESCILWSPIASYGKIPLYFAQFAQNSIEKVFADCESDSSCHLAYPALEDEFRHLMEKGRLLGFNIRHPNSYGHNEPITISWNAFQTKLRYLLYSPSGMREIPYVVHQAYLGNFSPFIDMYPKGIDTSYFIAEGMYLCVTCAEDVPFISKNEIDSLTKGTFMGSYRIDQQKRACDHWTRGKIPVDFLEPTKSDIPTLIISGSKDPVTPPSVATEIASHLSRATLVIIPEMSHTFDGLSHTECFDEMCLSFLKNPTIKMNTDCIKLMKPGSFVIDK